MKRIVIIGCGGAGKSTLAREIGRIARLPVIHLDAELWQPGWTMRSDEEERAILERLAGQDAWIMDGNYGSTMPARFEAADTIIFLDFARRLCLWRVVKRFARYRGTSRPDMAPGCPEKLDRAFLGWIWSYRKIYRPRVLQLIEEHGQACKVLIFRHPKEVEKFLSTLGVLPRQT